MSTVPSTRSDTAAEGMALAVANIGIVVALFFTGAILLSRSAVSGARRALLRCVLAVHPAECGAGQKRRRRCSVIAGGQFNRTGSTQDPTPTEVYPVMPP